MSHIEEDLCRERTFLSLYTQRIWENVTLVPRQKNHTTVFLELKRHGRNDDDPRLFIAIGERTEVFHFLGRAENTAGQTLTHTLSRRGRRRRLGDGRSVSRPSRARRRWNLRSFWPDPERKTTMRRRRPACFYHLRAWMRAGEDSRIFVRRWKSSRRVFFSK